MFLIVSLFFNMTVYAAEREEITDITVETVTVSEMLSMQITKMAAECGTDLTVSRVKPLCSIQTSGLGEFQRCTMGV